MACETKSRKKMKRGMERQIGLTEERWTEQEGSRKGEGLNR